MYSISLKKKKTTKNMRVEQETSHVASRFRTSHPQIFKVDDPLKFELAQRKKKQI